MSADWRARLTIITIYALVINIGVLLGYYGSSLYWYWNAPVLDDYLILAQVAWVTLAIAILVEPIAPFDSDTLFDDHQ